MEGSVGRSLLGIAVTSLFLLARAVSIYVGFVPQTVRLRMTTRTIHDSLLSGASRWGGCSSTRDPSDSLSYKCEVHTNKVLLIKAEKTVSFCVLLGHICAYLRPSEISYSLIPWSVRHVSVSAFSSTGHMSACFGNLLDACLAVKPPSNLPDRSSFVVYRNL